MKRKRAKSSGNSNQIEQLQVDHPINNVSCIWHSDLDVKRTISVHTQVWGVLTGLWSKKKAKDILKKVLNNPEIR